MNHILARFFNDKFPTQKSIPNFSVHKNPLLTQLKREATFSEANTYYSPEIVTNSTVCPTIPTNIRNNSKKKTTHRRYNTRINLHIYNKEEIAKNANDIVSTLLEEKNDDLEYADVKKHDIPKEQAIDPIFYIKNDLQYEPDVKKNYKSINLQIKCLGNLKNRHILIKGVNDYELHSVKYKNLNNYIGEYKGVTNGQNRNIKKQIERLFSDGDRLPKVNSKKIHKRNVVCNELYMNYLPSLGFPKTLDERMQLSYNSAKKTLMHFEERRSKLKQKIRNVMNFLNYE